MRRRLLAWLRFRGWRNAYWREDWYHTICPHDGAIHIETSSSNVNIVLQRICVICGEVLRP